MCYGILLWGYYAKTTLVLKSAWIHIGNSPVLTVTIMAILATGNLPQHSLRVASSTPKDDKVSVFKLQTPIQLTFKPIATWYFPCHRNSHSKPSFGSIQWTMPTWIKPISILTMTTTYLAPTIVNNVSSKDSHIPTTPNHNSSSNWSLDPGQPCRAMLQLTSYVARPQWDGSSIGLACLYANATWWPQSTQSWLSTCSDKPDIEWHCCPVPNPTVCQEMPIMMTTTNHLSMQDCLDEPSIGTPNCSLFALIFSKFCQEILTPMTHIIKK